MTPAGSYETVAEPVIRFTLADLTPGVRSSARWMRALHAAQVIPWTGIVQEAGEVAEVAVTLFLCLCGGAVPGLGYGRLELGGPGDAFVVAHVRPADSNRIDPDSREGPERAVHRVEAVATTHAFDM